MPPSEITETSMSTWKSQSVLAAFVDISGGIQKYGDFGSFGRGAATRFAIDAVIENVMGSSCCYLSVLMYSMRAVISLSFSLPL